MFKMFAGPIVVVGLLLFFVVGVGHAQATCSDTDYNGDGVTDQIDADIFQAALGTRDGDLDFVAQADYDGDGEVTTIDFSVLLQCLQSS